MKTFSRHRRIRHFKCTSGPTSLALLKVLIPFASMASTFVVNVSLGRQTTAPAIKVREYVHVKTLKLFPDNFSLLWATTVQLGDSPSFYPGIFSKGYA